MGAANLLASSGQDVDFFIHGVFSYELFGQTFCITHNACGDCDRHASGCDICDCGKDYDQSCKEVSDRVPEHR